MKLLSVFSCAFALAACTQEPPVEPTDGPCGPGAWIIIEGPDGSIECKRDGW